MLGRSRFSSSEWLGRDARGIVGILWRMAIMPRENHKDMSVAIFAEPPEFVGR